MACNQYRVYNPESFTQEFRFKDCDGYGYTLFVTAGYTTGARNISEILDIGTMILLDADGNPIDPEQPPVEPPVEEEVVYTGEIRYHNDINWGEVYEASYFHYDSTLLDNNFGIVYTVEDNSDSWRYQLTDFDVENSTWNEL